MKDLLALAFLCFYHLAVLCLNDTPDGIFGKDPVEACVSKCFVGIDNFKPDDNNSQLSLR